MKINNWVNISIEQFNAIQDALTKEYKSDHEKMCALVHEVYGVNYEQLPLADAMAISKDIMFLNEPMPQMPIKKEYKIGGVTYKVSQNLADFSVAQYMDFMAAVKANDLAGKVAAFLIPEGHTYANGYDILKAKSDIERKLSVCDAYAIAFFLHKCAKKCMKRIVLYSQVQVMAMKMPVKMRVKLTAAMERLCKITDCCPTY